jgi:hypothetical protein
MESSAKEDSRGDHRVPASILEALAFCFVRASAINLNEMQCENLKLKSELK